MNRNIKLAYILTVVKSSWFWMAIWVFYYLRFTDYAGIGLIETIVISMTMVAEVPTGAIADIIGRKWTVLLAFLIEGLGNLIMAASPTLGILLISLPFLAIGSAFYSGSMEALVYDTLKEKKEENKYNRVIANITTCTLVTYAVVAIAGGLLYQISPRLPFVVTGLFYMGGAVLSLFLREPQIDSQKFSWLVFVKQNTQGFKQLFLNKGVRRWTIYLLAVTTIAVITFEMLNDILAVEFGFTPLSWSWVLAIIFIFASLVSQLGPILTNKIHKLLLFSVITIIIGLTLFVSPWVGMVAGGITIALRHALQFMFNNLTSGVLNEQIESSVRATTLSTFTLLSRVPYVFLAFFIGVTMQTTGARNFALVLGGILIAVAFFPFLLRNYSESKH